MSVLGYFLHGQKLCCRRSVSGIVLLSGIWVCGLPSLYPLVNLGKLHPLLNLLRRDHTTAAPKPPRLSYPRIFNWTKTLWLLDHISRIVSALEGALELKSSRRSYSSPDNRMHTDDHRVQFWFRSHQFDQKLPMHNENSHCQKRDEGITSRHCGVAKGSQFSARSLEVTIV